MKKLLAILLCVVVFLCVGVACTDQNKQGNKDDIKSQIVGTWVGISEDNSAENYRDRYFWAEIKTTNDKVYPYSIQIFEVSEKENNTSRELRKGVLTYNSVKKCFHYVSADLSMWGAVIRGDFEYVITMNNKDKFICSGEESYNSKTVSSTYIFERSKLTLKEYENQVKNKA